MEAGSALYMLALMPGGAVAERLEEIRQEFARKYGCRAALRPPIHITLIPPFRAAAGDAAMLDGLLSGPVSTHAAFTVHFDGYGVFTGNRVVYVNVVAGAALLALQGEVETLMAGAFPGAIAVRPEYHPHFTIGRKDIPRARFPEAAAEYSGREFKGDFFCEELALLRHDGSRWQVRSTYRFLPELRPSDARAFK